MAISGREAAMARRRRQSATGGDNVPREPVAGTTTSRSGRDLAKARRAALSETGAAGTRPPGDGGPLPGSPLHEGPGTHDCPEDCECRRAKAASKTVSGEVRVPSSTTTGSAPLVRSRGRQAAIARRQAQSRSGNPEPDEALPRPAAAAGDRSGREMARALRAARSRAGKGTKAGGRDHAADSPADSESGGPERADMATDTSPVAPPARPVTGSLATQSERMSGGESERGSHITGTEYAAGASSRVTSSGESGQHALTGLAVRTSARVTGDEAGAERETTGTRYEQSGGGEAPAKVGLTQTFRGNLVSGTRVGRGTRVTGDEAGSCRRVTGNEYVGAEQYSRYCTTRPPTRPVATSLSTTARGRSVTGTLTGRSPRVTGDEPGTCKAVTGTPYVGTEQLASGCSDDEQAETAARTPPRQMTPGPNLTGQQPGIAGALTGAERGACEPVTGTPYVGKDEYAEACGSGAVNGSAPDGPWTGFSVRSPARAALEHAQTHGPAEGSGAERMTGPFGMAHGKVTGTEQFGAVVAESQRAASSEIRVAKPSAGQRPRSRVTGEGMDAGLTITGDDWDRGDRVTGTEGSSATRRNLTRRGGPMSAMPMLEAPHRHEDDIPESPVTGGAGATSRGALVTVSGGARG